MRTAGQSWMDQLLFRVYSSFSFLMGIDIRYMHEGIWLLKVNNLVTDCLAHSPLTIKSSDRLSLIITHFYIGTSSSCH